MFTMTISPSDDVGDVAMATCTRSRLINKVKPYDPNTYTRPETLFACRLVASNSAVSAGTYGLLLA